MKRKKRKKSKPKTPPQRPRAASRAPSPVPNYRAQQKFLAALEHFDLGKPKSAINLLRSAIRISPGFADAIGLLEHICRDSGLDEPLRAGLQDAVAGGNRDPEVLGQLVLMSLGAGNGEDARRYLDIFQDHFPRRRKIGQWRITELRRDLRLMSGDPWSEPAPLVPPAPPAPPARPAPGPRPLGRRRAARDKPAPTASPAAPALLAPPTLEALPIRTTVEDGDLSRLLTSGELTAGRHHELRLAAHRLAMVNSIDELLCLATLQGVRELWFQTETVRKVLRRFRGRALLCDEVGLGKTVEAGMIIKEYLLRGLVRSVLVLVPPSLVAQWREEMSVKFGLSFATTSDVQQKRDPDAFWAQNRMVIASLALARSARNLPRLTARQFDLIVVDEAHHLRNRKTKAWQLLNQLKSRFLLLLTATPLQNNLEELHNLITLLKPGQLKTRAAFMREFVSAEDPTVPLNEERLRDLIADVMIRNTRALAGLRLPPRYAATVTVEPAPIERELYDRLSSLVRQAYRGGNGAPGLNRLTLRLLQSEAGSSPWALLKTVRKLAAGRDPADPLSAELKSLAEMAGSLTSHTKLEALAKHLQSSHEKTIVFVGFRETLAFAAADLRGRGLAPILFHGGLTADEKEAAIDSFRDDKGSILLTTEVGGEGRNLQFCHRMVNFDLPWNPMRIEQRIGRIHRIGQEHEIEIINFCAQGSVEDHLLEILDKKINLFELVIGEVDLILGQLEGRREFSERVLEAWAAASSGEDAAVNFTRLSDELGLARASYERIKALDDTLFGEDYEV